MQKVENITTHTLSNPSVNKPHYPFVDWIRFVAMFSIVYEHSLVAPEGKPDMVHFNSFTAMTQLQQEAFLWISQPLKFGTICFFTISGFLLGKQLKSTQQAFAYYKKRLAVVGIPFLLAFLLFYIKSIGIFGIMVGRFSLSILSQPKLVDQLWHILFATSYWFIFIFLLSLALMLLGWRYLGLRVTAILSFFATLFYAANVYMNWIEPRHTFAFPAFIFYICLGVWLSRNDHHIKRVQSFSIGWLGFFLMAIFLIASAESILLWKLNSIDPKNTLRLSNQIFSLVIFLCLLRVNLLSKLPILNPRTESFGIYLYHLFFVSFITKLITLTPALSFLNYQEHYTGWELAWASALRFLLVYVSTLLFVKVLNQTRLRWILGN
ncbi:acyltransferase family protein [Spirosoma horti]